jgi:hypothetical protein
MLYDRYDGKLFYLRVHGESYEGKLDTISQILDDCIVRVNFWGSRELVSKSNMDMPMVPLALETIATRTLQVGYDQNKIMHIDEDLSPNDLKLKYEIYKKIKNFYSTSDIQIANSNPIAKTFNTLREQFRPFAQLVNLIGSISGYGIECPTVRQQIEEYTKK